MTDIDICAEIRTSREKKNTWKLSSCEKIQMWPDISKRNFCIENPWCNVCKIWIRMFLCISTSWQIFLKILFEDVKKRKINVIFLFSFSCFFFVEKYTKWVWDDLHSYLCWNPYITREKKHMKIVILWKMDFLTLIVHYRTEALFTFAIVIVFHRLCCCWMFSEWKKVKFSESEKVIEMAQKCTDRHWLNTHLYQHKKWFSIFYFRNSNYHQHRLHIYINTKNDSEFFISEIQVIISIKMLEVRIKSGKMRFQSRRKWCERQMSTNTQWLWDTSTKLYSSESMCVCDQQWYVRQKVMYPKKNWFFSSVPWKNRFHFCHVWKEGVCHFSHWVSSKHGPWIFTQIKCVCDDDINEAYQVTSMKLMIVSKERKDIPNLLSFCCRMFFCCSCCYHLDSRDYQKKLDESQPPQMYIQ